MHLKVPVEFVLNCRFILPQIFYILLCGCRLKLQKVSDIFLSPVGKDLVSGSPCMPGINVTLASCPAGSLRLTWGLKWGNSCLCSYLQLLQKKKNGGGWWRMVEAFFLPTSKIGSVSLDNSYGKAAFKAGRLAEQVQRYLKHNPESSNTRRSPPQSGKINIYGEKKVQMKQTHNCVVFCCWQRPFWKKKKK